MLIRIRCTTFTFNRLMKAYAGFTGNSESDVMFSLDHTPLILNFPDRKIFAGICVIQGYVFIGLYPSFFYFSIRYDSAGNIRVLNYAAIGLYLAFLKISWWKFRTWHIFVVIPYPFLRILKEWCSVESLLSCVKLPHQNPVLFRTYRVRIMQPLDHTSHSLDFPVGISFSDVM